MAASKSTTLLRTLSMQEGERQGAGVKKPNKSIKIEILSQSTNYGGPHESFLKGIFSDDPVRNPPLPYSACGSGLFLNNFSRERAIAKMKREAKLQKMNEISLALRNQGITQQITRFREKELDLRLSDLKQKEVKEEYERRKAEAAQNQNSVPVKDTSKEPDFTMNTKLYGRLMKIKKQKRSTSTLSYKIKYESVEPRSRVCNFKGRGHCFGDILKPLDIKMRPCLERINYTAYSRNQPKVDFDKMLGRSQSEMKLENLHGQGRFSRDSSTKGSKHNPAQSMMSTTSSTQGTSVFKLARKSSSPVIQKYPILIEP